MLEASSPKGRFPNTSSVDELDGALPHEIARMQEELNTFKDKILEDEWDMRNAAAPPKDDLRSLLPQKKDPLKQLRNFFKPSTYESAVKDTNFTANKYKKKLARARKGAASVLRSEGPSRLHAPMEEVLADLSV